MSKRILVTGGAGFIGSFLVDKLLAKGHKVRVFDNLTPQVHPTGDPPAYLNPDVELVKGDVLSRTKLLRALKGVDVVYHFAAAVGVGQSQYQIAHYVHNNVGGTAMLFDILANEKHSVEHVIVAGSKTAYGEGLYEHPARGRVRPPLRTEADVADGQWEPRLPDDPGTPLTPLPTDESQALIATNVYGFTKQHQEEYALLLGQVYNIPVTVLRYFQVYGPRQSLSNPYTGVTAIFMCLLKNNRQPVIFEDGAQGADLICVHDIVGACAAVLDKPERAAGQVFNVGSGNEITIRQLAETIARIYGKDIEPQITGKFRKGDTRHCYADITRLREQLGYRPKVELEDGLREVVEWGESAEGADNFDNAQQELVARGLM